MITRCQYEDPDCDNVMYLCPKCVQDAKLRSRELFKDIYSILTSLKYERISDETISFIAYGALKQFSESFSVPFPPKLNS